MGGGCTNPVVNPYDICLYSIAEAHHTDIHIALHMRCVCEYHGLCFVY